ncbi:cytochrome P450 CYP72A219-like [Andrographis paniculata]|uniref:cytochrome P450 CYP72A219-like n=1 Tax=Andrographis paniculata TaxID=175694 RepID=UPI0021E83232|nr:cytochrome P450 CYP72A219-like [Andrographis paniculata]
MEIMDFQLISKLILNIFLLMFIFCSIRIFYSVWWKPKSLEKYFRRIGVAGSSYRLFSGDLKEAKKLMSEAAAKPMTLSHDIVPRVQPYWDRMVREHGKISGSWHGTTAQVVVADAAIIRQILNARDGSFQKVPRNPLVKLLTLGVSTLEGRRWETRRKLVSPAFHHDKLLGMIPTFLTSCSNLVERLTNKIEGSSGNLELDIAPEMHRLASDIIARAAFGVSFEEAETIFKLQKEQAALVLDAASTVYFPGSRFLPTKRNRRMYEIDRAIKAKLRDMILEKERKIGNGEMGGDEDLLSLLLKSQKQSGNDMTIDDVMEECKLFYFAGQETTANWLMWTMIVLSMHPQWQEKAREEVLHVFGKKIPDVKTLNQLKIVSMILQEVLRLYPSVPITVRHTHEAIKIRDKIIPPGVNLVLPTLLLHHNPVYWGEDAEEFKPDRFAEGVSKAGKDHDELAFYPFGWGPRICLGQNFAVMEAKLALTMILQNFVFELSPSYTHAPRAVLTLQPQYGAPLILRKL